MTKRQKWILLFCGALLVAALVMDFFTRPSIEINVHSKKIENYLHELEAEVEQEIVDKSFIKQCILSNPSSLSANSYDAKRIKNLANKPYTICIYKDQELVFWSNNLISPSKKHLTEFPKRTSSFVNLENGYYMMIKETYLYPNMGEFRVFALIPIKYEYPLETDYLLNDFAIENKGRTDEKSWMEQYFGVNLFGKTNIPKEIVIDKEGDNLITDLNDEPLFRVKAESEFVEQKNLLAVLGLYFLVFVLLSIVVDIYAKKLCIQYSPWIGVSTLAAYFLIVRFIMYIVNFSEKFSSIPLFSKSFNSGILGNSLGDIVINIIICLWLAIFFHKQTKGSNAATLSLNQKIGFTGAAYFGVILGVLFIARIIKKLVLESNIPFDFENIFNLDANSFLAIIGIMLLLVALFIVTHRISVIVSNTALALQNRLLALGLVSLLMIPFIHFVGGMSWEQVWQLVLFSIIYIISFDIFVENEKTNFTWLVVWLVIFSLFSSYLLHRYNIEKERNLRLAFAKDLSDERNKKFESELDKLGKEILIGGSSFEQNLSKNEIAETIEQNFAIDLKYFNYSYELFAFYKNKQIPIEGGTEGFDEFQQKIIQSIATPSPYVKFWQKKSGRTQYLLVLEIPLREQTDILQLILEFSPRTRQSSKVYTELFADDESKKHKQLLGYDYAIYRDNQVIDNQGSQLVKFENKLKEDLIPPVGEYAFKDFNIKGKKYSELIYHADNGGVVLVAKELSKTWSKWGSLFCYLFAILVLVLVFLIILNTIIGIIPNNFELPFTPSPSLRNKIQLSVIVVIFLNFIAIGFFTVQYSNKSTEEYHENRSVRKARTVTKDAKRDINILNITEDSISLLQDLAIELSTIHRTDINVYNTNGLLIASSEEEIFKRGLIAPRMSGKAFLQLVKEDKENASQEEKVGNLSYNATYVSLNDENDKTVAYLGIPYYEKQANLREDNSQYMSSLLNLYVFLLIIAGAIAIGVANSITRPISEIGEKLKRVKLGKRNEPLEWRSQDELGVLIGEYNKMISKLENSALLLAQSERESAWREMAKQVAHEIKNPLTPMKLSIQYLQHAYRSNPENIEPMLKRVTYTLIEQIDNLSQIATEFSNFAKMPRAENEKFVLNTLIESVHELFSERDNPDLTVELVPYNQQLNIFADKNQLMRVFNNLIKNATQAIPEDRKGEVIIRYYKQDENAIIKVCDNGVGIPDNMRDYVFVPNFTTKNSGTGLGLAISKSIIESLEGSIYFESKEGVGTCFYVEIPIVDTLKEVEI